MFNELYTISCHSPKTICNLCRRRRCCRCRLFLLRWRRATTAATTTWKHKYRSNRIEKYSKKKKLCIKYLQFSKYFRSLNIPGLVSRIHCNMLFRWIFRFVCFAFKILCSAHTLMAKVNIPFWNWDIAMHGSW